MNLSNEHELLARRERLIARSAEVRGSLVVQLQAMRRPPPWVHGVEVGWQWVRTHPEWVVGAVVVLVVVRPRRVLEWGGGLFGAWKLLRSARLLRSLLLARRR